MDPTGNRAPRTSAPVAGAVATPGATATSTGITKAEQPPLVPPLSLPKGGGAIRGIGEKYATNPATGSPSLVIPIYTSPGRSDIGPELSLSYQQGAGNGPFGLGWVLSLPAVTRKTEKGLPRYNDADESDVFILSDAEDLVPALIFNGTEWVADSRTSGQFAVRRYLPRVEGLFARIERWRNTATGDIYWQSTTKDNITSVYGRSADRRIADPSDPSRVFKWLLEETRDDKGNVIVYEYKAEDFVGVDPMMPQEAQRLSGLSPIVNTYLKRVLYGNTTPFTPGDWFFEVVFDYGEHDTANPTPTEARPWPTRLDAFSSYRAGFEIRTYRVCRRVLMFHTFKELGPNPLLVRSTDLGYELSPVVTLLSSITATGYIKDPNTGTYSTLSMPPLSLTYTPATLDPTVHMVDAASVENLPGGADGKRYTWVDLDSEGISGVLTEQSGGWYYKRNLGGGRLGPVETVATLPSLAHLAGGRQQVLDLASDGRKYLVQFNKPVAGYYERGTDGQWDSFVPFDSCPNVDWHDPNLRTIDLDGDGYADLLFSLDEAFVWYPSRAKKGFGTAEMVHKPGDESHGPALVFAGEAESLHLADMTGDGLTDLVRIRNGEVCYWPNLGYGRFGARVVMDGAPLFDYPDRFDPKRLRLADIDGSGTTDLAYLGGDGFTFWLNQSGNSLEAAQRLPGFPQVDELASVAVMDLLGTGTSCVVWSSPLPGVASQPLRYIDLMSGTKPYLLDSITNNLGAVTSIQYAPSTQFYLADRAAGQPWITRIPFPVPLVTRVEVHDGVTDTRLVTRYAYHHGYYDGDEREFHGFGMVEQWDSETFADTTGAGIFDTSPSGVEQDLRLPPVHTKTWFHTGVYRDRDNISRRLASEYYSNDAQATPLPDTQLPTGLNTQEERELCRALKGKILRQEVYADDATPASAHPYTVTEHTYQLRLVQPLAANRHAAVYAYEAEAVSYQYERKPNDPRMSHLLTLEVDLFGNVTKSATVGYPRRVPAYPEQGQLLITYTEADCINAPDAPGSFRHNLPAETRTYEVTGTAPAAARFALSELTSAIAGAGEVAFEATPTPGTPQKRLFKRSRTLYYTDDLSTSLPLGQAGTRALPYEQYTQAFTPGLLTQVYGTRVDAAMLAEGGYIQQGSVWWTRSGRRIFDSARFYLPVRALDAFGNATDIQYDTHALLITQIVDALINPARALNDYRLLRPYQITDANDNRTAAASDALGQVVATAEMGKQGAGEGDTLADPTAKVEYRLTSWMTNGKPCFAHTFARERHGAANPRWQETYSYSDGLGREVMRKVQAESGMAPARNPNGVLLAGTQVETTPNVRWVGTGRTIFDNKGNPVKQYEPFFTTTPDYETEVELVQWGVTPVLRYDPLSRLIRTDFPDGSFSRVELDSWRQATWDRNDTVTSSRWYSDRSALPPTTPDGRAAQLAAAHAGTPALAHFDSLGRTFLTIADNGAAGQYSTHTTLDIEGNQRAVTDALNRQALAADFDMLKRALHTSSPDAGERWTLADVAGKPIRGWDSRGFATRHTYDALRRPAQVYVKLGSNAEILAEMVVYGEIHPQAIALNVRGRTYQSYDGAGCATSGQYDFKGNLLSSSRQLAVTYKQTPDWSPLAGLTNATAIATAAASLLEAETFTTSMAYDALNRVTSQTTPDASELRPTYNESNLLARVDARLRGATTWTPFVANVDYDAKGQRTRIVYDSGARTDYTYDPYTFRLARLRTTRASDGATLQDLAYTYDPAGNITEMGDSAQQTVFFNNAMVAPGAQYTYDALYRLTQAAGREHAANGSSAQSTEVDVPLAALPDPSNSQALRGYTESYTYDAVGNVLQVSHQAAGGNWSRYYAYANASNRLLSTSLPGDPATGPYSATYTYDAGGNMASMPHLAQMSWDCKGQLQQADLGGGGTAYYAYDAKGQRVRRVIARPGVRTVDRFYLGAYELYRQRNGGLVLVERQTLHVMDDKRRIALVETLTQDVDTPPSNTPRIRYQLGNLLDSACLELDETAAVISYEEYYPYGASSYRAARSGGVEVSVKRYRYIGKERDDETSLYYHVARYYAPWLARWTSPDPAGMVDGPCRYAYTRNNPIRLRDPSGTQGQEQDQKNKPKSTSATDKPKDTKAPEPPQKGAEENLSDINLSDFEERSDFPGAKQSKDEGDDDQPDYNAWLLTTIQGASDEEKKWIAEVLGSLTLQGSNIQGGGVTALVRKTWQNHALGGTATVQLDQSGNVTGFQAGPVYHGWAKPDKDQAPVEVGLYVLPYAGYFTDKTGKAVGYLGIQGIGSASHTFDLGKGVKLELDLNASVIGKTNDQLLDNSIIGPVGYFGIGAGLTLKPGAGVNISLEGIRTWGGGTRPGDTETTNIDSYAAGLGVSKAFKSPLRYIGGYAGYNTQRVSAPFTAPSQATSKDQWTFSLEVGF